MTTPFEVPVAGVADTPAGVEIAGVRGSVVDWNFTRGNRRVKGFGMSPTPAPVVKVGSRYGWAGSAPDFRGGGRHRRSIDGRLRAAADDDEAQPQTVEVPLEPIGADLRLRPRGHGGAAVGGRRLLAARRSDGQTIAGADRRRPVLTVTGLQAMIVHTSGLFVR